MKIIRELGIFERAQVIADRYSPFHIVGVLQLEDAPHPNFLKKTISELQKRHPFLSAHLTSKKKRLYFQSMTDTVIPFNTIPRLNDEHWKDIVEFELATRIDSITGPMFRCTYLFDESQQRGDIILTISHSIADAASASHLLHELMLICASRADGKPVSVSELPTVPPQESRFPPAFRGWRFSLYILRYTLIQMADEISYRIRTIGKRTPPFHRKSARGHILAVQLPSDLFEPFAQRARKERVTLNSALNAALLLAVNRHLYDGANLPMRSFSFADLRPYLEPPLPAENLGLYISMMRYTVEVDGSGDLWPLARDLHEKIYASLKSGDKFVASTMSESLLKMLTRFDSFRVCASALNYNGVVPLQTRYGKFKVNAVHGFVSAYAFGPEIASQAQLFDDKLFWDLAYLEEDMNRETAKAIVEEIKGIMKAAVEQVVIVKAVL
jgi:hypothetical protein